jgi:hypothetical protein
MIEKNMVKIKKKKEKKRKKKKKKEKKKKMHSFVLKCGSSKHKKRYKKR